MYLLFNFLFFFFFFFNDTATTEIYTLSLHDALPISGVSGLSPREPRSGRKVATVEDAGHHGPPPGVGELADRTRIGPGFAARPRHRQSGVAAVFRRRDRRHAGQSWPQRSEADASGAARLARREVRRIRLEPESIAPARARIGDLPANERSARPRGRARPGEPP